MYDNDELLLIILDDDLFPKEADDELLPADPADGV